MTVNHLIFSLACTAYILLAVTFLEEPDLKRAMPDYDAYARRVPAYCPFHCGRSTGDELAENLLRKRGE